MAESTAIWDRQFDEATGLEWIDEPQVEDLLISDNVVSLLNLGELRNTFVIKDHEIVLKTLRMDEELEIGLIVDKYVRTIEEGRAIATANVAASIVSINGKPLVAELGPDENLLQKKFDYVRTHLYWPVIKAIYEEGYIPLVQKQVDALEEFRKK